MKFNSSFILAPGENYKGLSYGQWAVIFWNWLFSDQTQRGHIYFLRGNVDNESTIVKNDNSQILIYSDVGVFFPIICTFNSSLNYPSVTNLIERRKCASESQRDPKLLRAQIDDLTVFDPRKYYAETPEFILNVTRLNTVRTKFDPPVPSGKGLAVSAGYWILLKSLPVGNHTIEFEGIHKDGFRTFGYYFLTVKNR
jgi:hypothetical protein